jgi:HEAT repeat protein
LPSWVPFQGPASDVLPDVVPPSKRIAEYKRLAAESDKVGQEERTRVSEQLSATIRTEKDPLIRTEIVRALGVYPSPSADAILKAAVTDAEPQVRIAACEAWAKRRDDQAVQLLSAAMSGDVDSDVRLAAAKALGETRNPAAVKPLGEALNSDDPAMQYSAVLSLKKVTGKDFDNDVSRWQQFVRGETPAPPPTLAERMRRLF